MTFWKKRERGPAAESGGSGRIESKGKTARRREPVTELRAEALTRDQLAELLSAAGYVASSEIVADDIAAGAPVNADGTLHLIHYTAWLASQVQ